MQIIWSQKAHLIQNIIDLTFQALIIQTAIISLLVNLSN